MSNIDPTKPTSGRAYTEDVRNNFNIARQEISALQSGLEARETNLPLRSDFSSDADHESAADAAGAQLLASQSRFKQSGTGATERTVEEKVREEASVTDFENTNGTKVAGDGTTDNTSGFVRAFSSGVRKVKVPAGTYIVEAATMPSNIVIEGEGDGVSILKLKSGASTPQILKTSSAKENITIRGLGFDCNGVTSGVALQITDVTNGRVEGCRFTSKYGVYLTGTCDQIKVIGNTFDANDYGLITENSSTTTNVSVVGNAFKDCPHDGVEINCPTGSARGWTISGNTFDNIGSNASTSGFGVGASGGTSYIDGLTIVGNTFHQCDHHAIHIEDGCRNVTIKGNTILDTGNGGSQGQISGVYVATAAALNRAISNVVVEGNVIKGVSDMDYGIYVAGSHAQTGAVIRDNVIQGALLYGILTGSVWTGVDISGNVIYNCAGPGIRQAASKAVVSGNVCFDNQGSPTQTYGIEINTGTDVVYSHNVLVGNATGAFLITSSGTRNRFIGNLESTSETSALAGSAVALGGRINFPATQNASSDPNTLDDYEEGTWTPVLSFATPGDLAVTYSAQVGHYTKVGREVRLSFNITTSAFTHSTASGECLISGLPFAPASASNYQWQGSVQWQGVTKANYTHMVARIVTGISDIRFPMGGSGQASSNLSTADMPSGGTVVLRGTITYHV